MLAYRHSVSGAADYKTELQARRYGLIWEYCCRLMVHCDAFANEAAINIGGPSFSKEWLEVNQKEEVSSIEFGSDVAEEFSCSSVSVVRPICRHHLAPRSTLKSVSSDNGLGSSVGARSGHARKPHLHVRFCEQQSSFEDTPKTLRGRAPTVLQHHEWLDGVYHNAACAHKKRCQAHARINSSLAASGEVTCVQSWPLHAAESRKKARPP